MEANDYRMECIRMARGYLRLGMDIVRCERGEIKRFISQTAAWKQYGKVNVQRWFEDGLITPSIQGNRKLYDSLELQNLAIGFNATAAEQVERKSKAGRKPKKYAE